MPSLIERQSLLNNLVPEYSRRRTDEIYRVVRAGQIGHNLPAGQRHLPHRGFHHQIARGQGDSCHEMAPSIPRSQPHRADAGSAEKRVRALPLARNLDDLWDRVQEAWNKIKASQCKRLVASLPHRLEEVRKVKGGHTKF